MDERITDARNSVVSGLSPGIDNPISLHTDESSVYRVTGINQIKDIIECGYVRPKGYGARSRRVGNVIYWSQGNDKLYYCDKRPVIESSIDKVKNNQKGAVSINDLTAIWIFNDEHNKYENKLNEIKKLHNQRFHEKYDNKELTIDEMSLLFTESGYQCIGHGTGRSGNGIETILSIFENGLRTKDNSLSFTGIPLSTPTPEIIQSYKDLNIDIPTLDTLKNSLNKWEHLNSKKIVIARLPIAYINWYGDRDDLDSEMYGAFMNDVKQENGNVKYYLDSRFILGYYDADKQRFIINSKYERALTDETLNKLQIGYLKALKKTEIRHKRALEMFPIGNKEISSENNINQSGVDDFDIVDFNDTDIEWDFSENNSKSK